MFDLPLVEGLVMRSECEMHLIEGLVMQSSGGLS